MPSKKPSDHEEKIEEAAETDVVKAQVEKATKAAAKKHGKKRRKHPKDVVFEEYHHQLPYARERTQFRALTLANPNYFGNLEFSPFPPVVPISGNTDYEKLVCVGYHPQQKQLEAVVHLYQPAGYGTDICGPGTPEYVRFYLSTDHGVTWQDQGVTSFQAYNIPEGTESEKRLEYAVSLKVDPDQKLCFSDPLIQVRAILSWNDPPPENQPNWPPVWGNVLEKTIQVEPRRVIFPPEIFDLGKIKLSPLLEDVIDPEVSIQTKTNSLNAAELAVHYHNKGVPVHRFAFKEISNFVSAKTSLSAEEFATLLPDITIDPSIADLLFPEADGDKSYEELTCIGLDPNHPNTLVGVIKVKKSSGYSGGPCTAGSLEHVTFWADFDENGSFETCLGTASVRVYDLDVPPDGVYYAVRLPIDLNDYRQACEEGPKVVRIRAILSWSEPAECSDPNQIPTWGNREETLIHIAPVAGAPAGKIAILGGIPVGHIDDVTGFTTRTARFATNNLPPDPHGRPCPFAGRVTVQGVPLLGHSYKVEVTPFGGGAPTAVVTELELTRFDGTTFMHRAHEATGRFDYLPFDQNVNGLLAEWDTTGHNSWVVTLSTFDRDTLVGTDSHVIQLDNTPPEAEITITTGTTECGKAPVGTTLSGTFVARDIVVDKDGESVDNLRSYSLRVAPAVNDPGEGIPNPSSGLVNTPPAPGNVWSLDTGQISETGGMKPCGYVISVVATDRAIVNSQSAGRSSPPASVGFCLEEPDEG